MIGTFSGALDDEAAREIGVSFHTSLIAGKPVAQALHDAIVAGRPIDAPRSESRLSYGLSGYGDLTLRPGTQTV